MDEYNEIFIDYQNKSIFDKFNNFFKIHIRGSTLKTEILSGIIIYATIAYIIFVNPLILSDANMDVSITTNSTVLVIGLFSIIFGLITNMPFVVGPGMGLNTMFANELVKGYNGDWRKGLFFCFCLSCIYLLISVTGICSYLINKIPSGIKNSIIVGIGTYQTLIGLVTMKIIQNCDTQILCLSSIKDEIWIGILCFSVIMILQTLENKYAILIGIVISTIFSILMGFTHIPEDIFSLPKFSFYEFNYDILEDRITWTELIPFLLVLILDVGGCIYAGSDMAGLLVNDKLSNLREIFVCIGVGNIICSVITTSPMIIFVESFVGIQSGGRTGIVPITVGILFLLSIFFTPLFKTIPHEASAPVLIFIGSIMIKNVKYINWDNYSEAFPCFLVIIFITFTYSISYGIIIGISCYIIINICIITKEFLIKCI